MSKLQGPHAESSPGSADAAFTNTPDAGGPLDWEAEVAAGDAAVDDQAKGSGPDSYNDDRYEPEVAEAMKAFDRGSP